MDECLHDLLFVWCVRHCPALLEDEGLFLELHNFIHRLLLKQHREDRSKQMRLMERMIGRKN